MGLFLSTYINKLDKKGRVSIPAPFRNALQTESFHGVILYRSYKFQAVEGCTISRMQKLSDSVDNLGVFSDAQDDLASVIFADAHQVPIDSDGRITMPEALISHACIQDAIAFVGRGATFQIWSPELFETLQNQARKRIAEQKLTLQLTQNTGEK